MTDTLTCWDISLTELIQKWLTELEKLEGYSSHTLSAYRHDIYMFLMFVSQHTGDSVTIEKLSTLTQRDMRAWLAERHRKDMHAHSTRRSLSAIKQWARFIEKHAKNEDGQPLQLSIITSLRPPRGESVLPKALQADQALLIIEQIANWQPDTWIGLRDKAVTMLLYGCGMRISEALSLTIHQLDYSTMTVRVQGKGGKSRQIPLLFQITNSINEYTQLCPFPTDGNILFYGKKGKKLNAPVLQRQLQTIRQKLMLPEYTTPHAFRHSYATHLLQAGGNLKDIQELLGHASLATTQRYTNVDIRQLLMTYNNAHPLGNED